MKKTYLFILLFITCTSTLSYAKNILLQAPPEVSKETIDKTIDQDISNQEMLWTSCFSSNFGSRSKSCIKFSIAFGANYNSGFQLILTGNKLINQLTEKERSLFKKEANTWTYHYGNVTNKQKKVKFSMFTQPLVIPQAAPTKLSVLEITKLIGDKNVIFYTGAGISLPVVPDMTELTSQLEILHDQNSGVDKFTHIIKFIRRTLKESDEVVKTINNFQKACLYGNPTSAHHAVKDIVLFKNWQLLTENFDLLHQRSGIEPLGRIGRTDKVDFYSLKKSIKPKYLKQIDFVVAIGLHSDEVGFLALYKKHNPKGKIIAINLVQPDYLGNNDISVLGDIQRTLPNLFEDLKQHYA